MKALDYRPDLDGLRGFGVLIVILFHVGFSEPSGGFVAVDMFFVISGFLITRLIRHEYLQSHDFSYSNFYLRRARRLMPSLYFTLAISFVIGAVIFAPNDLERFGGSVVHAIASLSNFYFWTEAGYFDAESSLKPLLHTWSLGVEEQFYLVWPVCLVALLSKAPRYAVSTIVVVGSFSLLLNLVFADGDIALLNLLAPSTAKWFADGGSTIYFLAPFRVFEFAIGSAAVWWLERPAPRRAIAEPLAALGLAMLVVPMFVYTEDTLFPSVFALPPCLGTAFLIYTRDAKTNRLLGSRWLVGLGLASYSIYLIHQPIMAFYRYRYGELSTVEQLALSVASVVVGLLMYRFVERPFRFGRDPEKRWSAGGFGFGCAMFALVLTLVAANPWATNGWTWRYGDSQAVDAFGDIDEYRHARDVALNGQLGGSFDRWKTKVLVVGDSVADDLVLALASNFGDGFDVQRDIYRPKCAPLLVDPSLDADQQCAEISRMLHRSIKIPVADEIYISFQTSSYFHAPEFVPIVEFLKQRARDGARIVLLGRGPEFPGFQAVAVSMLADGAALPSVEEAARRVAGDVGELDRQMQNAADELGIEFVPKFDTICSNDLCRFFTDDGTLIWWDQWHMTVAGSKWWGPRIVARLRGETIPQPAEPTEANPVLAESPQTPAEPILPMVQMSMDDASRILEEYGSVLSNQRLDGNTMFDESLLPRPKDHVRTALFMILKNLSNPQERATLEFAVQGLAFFQPGVGDDMPMDEVGPDGRAWRKTVEDEMLEIVRALAQSQQ